MPFAVFLTFYFSIFLESGIFSKDRDTYLENDLFKEISVAGDGKLGFALGFIVFLYLRNASFILNSL